MIGYSTLDKLLLKCLIRSSIVKFYISRYLLFTGFGGNNVAKFVDIQILVDIQLIVMKSVIFVWPLGQHVKLNATCEVS